MYLLGVNDVPKAPADGFAIIVNSISYHGNGVARVVLKASFPWVQEYGSNRRNAKGSFMKMDF